MTTAGVLTPHTAVGPELEIPTMSSDRVAILVSRIPVRGGTPEQLREGAVPSALDEAAVRFPPGAIDVLAYASTSSGYAIGVDGERDLVMGLRDRWHLPVVSSALAAADALHAYGIGRVTLVHPPWFEQAAGELGVSYFRAWDIDAVATRTDSLPADPAQVRPDHVRDWVANHLDDRVEAVFFGGNGFRAAGTVDDIERRTGALVLAANQVLLWAVLRATHTALPITGYGRLLREPPPGTVPTSR
jgi:maleate isomerase